MLCCISILYFPGEHLLHAYQPVYQAFTHLNIIPQSSGVMFEFPVVALNLVLNTIAIYSLTVQEARSLKPRCGLEWGMLSSGGSDGESTPCLSPGCWWPPVTLGIPWLAAASFQPLSPSSPLSLFVFSFSLSYEDTCH